MKAITLNYTIHKFIDILLDEFRGGKLGRITLETVET